MMHNSVQIRKTKWALLIGTSHL